MRLTASELSDNVPPPLHYVNGGQEVLWGLRVCCAHSILCLHIDLGVTYEYLSCMYMENQRTFTVAAGDLPSLSAAQTVAL